MWGDVVAYLEIIGKQEAAGALHEAYQAMASRPMPPAYIPDHGDAAGIIRAHSLDPELMRCAFSVSGTLSNDALPWHSRELVNAVTARENECFY